MRTGAAGGASWSNAPRIRRRTRLRTTAFPTAEETVTPNRGRGPPGPARYAVKVEKDEALPRRRTNAISARRRKGSYQRTVERPSDGQALAALLAPACDHVASVLRGHPLHETMNPLAAAIVGLKRSLHCVLRIPKTGKYSRGSRPASTRPPGQLRRPCNPYTPVDKVVEKTGPPQLKTARDGLRAPNSCGGRLGGVSRKAPWDGPPPLQTAVWTSGKLCGIKPEESPCPRPID